MQGHRAAFVIASCAAPAVDLVMRGIRSLTQPMKLFGPTCVPFYLLIWAGLAALSYSASREYATWTRSEVPQVARSGVLIVLAGFLQGYAVAMAGYGVHGLMTVLALGPILFRSQNAPAPAQ